MSRSMDWSRARPRPATETLDGVLHDPGYRRRPPKHLPPSKAELREAGADAFAEWQTRKAQAATEPPPWEEESGR